MSNLSEWLGDELRGLQQQGLERSLTVYPESGGIHRDVGVRTLNLSSNDYLNLTHHPIVIQSAMEALKDYGAGSGSSRLVSGTLPLHEELEAALARHKQYPASLVFGSGFLTNLGVISSLLGRDDVVLADRLAHASLLDGIRLSRARLVRFQHNDVDHLQELIRKHQDPGRVLVVTESVFSMDGDLAPLTEIAECCERSGALLMVDEAHASGVFGPCGAGRIQELGLVDQVSLCMGTFSKGLGSYGGYLASSELVRRWLVNRARTFIYTTALPPAVIGASFGALRVLHENPDRGATLLARAFRFRNQLQEYGLDTLQSKSQIVPVLLGSNELAQRVSRQLMRQGILAVAIRPPTVPEGTARLRLSVTYSHTDEDLARAADLVINTIQQEST